MRGSTERCERFEQFYGGARRSSARVRVAPYWRHCAHDGVADTLLVAWRDFDEFRESERRGFRCTAPHHGCLPK